MLVNKLHILTYFFIIILNSTNIYAGIKKPKFKNSNYVIYLEIERKKIQLKSYVLNLRRKT